MSLDSHSNLLLRQVLTTVKSIEQNYRQLSNTVEAVQGQVNVLTGISALHNAAGGLSPCKDAEILPTDLDPSGHPTEELDESHVKNISQPDVFHNEGPQDVPTLGQQPPNKKPRAHTTSRIILTTYPNQSGIDPIAMNWGHLDPLQRGPVVVSRDQHTIRRRNGMHLTFLIFSNPENLCVAIGAHGGSYAIYHALAVAR